MENIRESFKEDKVKIITSFVIAGIFILIIWLVRFFEYYTKIDLGIYGVEPKVIKGLTGIITSPLIHADFEHLFSNTISLFLLTFGMFYFYRRPSLKVFTIIYLGTGLLVWIFGRPAFHIGASGLIYGFASYLFFMGVFRRDKGAMALSLLMVFLYGSLVWGLFPVDQRISFESHISGAVLGLLCAIIFRNSEPKKKYEWEEEGEEVDDKEYIPDEEQSDNTNIRNDADEVYFNTDENFDEELEKIKRKNRIK
ncbi:MAG TPA: rhomboid family intramembrane serine protease [Ignavibacteria bacterium]